MLSERSLLGSARQHFFVAADNLGRRLLHLDYDASDLVSVKRAGVYAQLGSLIKIALV